MKIQIIKSCNLIYKKTNRNINWKINKEVKQ